MAKTRFKLKGQKPFSFYQNLEYFHNDSNGSLIFINNKRYYVYERSLTVLQEVMSFYLTSYQSYFKTVTKVLNSKYNNPIVLGAYFSFIKTTNLNSYENIWINYQMISDIIAENQKLIITFISGNQLIINLKINYLDKQINKIIRLKTYLQEIK